jgi:GNAT superfamily N-acetyltransferase
MTALHIRPARSEDAPAIWRMLEPTVRAGETFALDRDMGEADAISSWPGSDRETFVAEAAGELVGTYYIRPNQAGGGRHVCNCGYLTSPAMRGRGIARAMCLHSIEHARRRGYRGMQFNFVVSSNAPAVSLWTSLGFEIVGRLPAAFEHRTLGYVDALVMFKSLHANDDDLPAHDRQRTR